MPTPATQKCDLNYGNCPDMINALLTGTGLEKPLRKQANGCFDSAPPPARQAVNAINPESRAGVAEVGSNNQQSGIQTANGQN
jgi:hypothetical protein